MEYINKSSYVGEWQQGKIQGYGVKTLVDNTQLAGEWQND